MGQRLLSQICHVQPFSTTKLRVQSKKDHEKSKQTKPSKQINSKRSRNELFHFPFQKIKSGYNRVDIRSEKIPWKGNDFREMGN